jgi:hypothetical protein
MKVLKNYVPGIYKNEFNLKLGKETIDFLNEQFQLNLLEAGVYYQRPSVYAISNGLKEKFGKEINALPKNKFDRYKQFVGNAVKQIMIANGYNLIPGRPTPISDKENLFRNGARYQK